MRMPLPLLLSFLCAFPLPGASAPAQPAGQTRHVVYFENTDYELHVYRIRGELPGKTLMIMGGLHNEPGGYLTADLYVDMALKQGSLIVIPRANLPSVLTNSRSVNGDMNRQFSAGAANGRETYEEKVVGVLKELMREADLILNLHDGSGFFRPTWISRLKNPSRWGQSIIADEELFFSPRDGNKITLRERALRVLEKVNAQIPDPEHRFHFNDTRTGQPDSPHPEMRGSATYFGLTQLGVESYGIETSKEIEPFALKLKYQTLVINAFMEEMGILPQYPKISLEAPRLEFLLISVNGGTPYGIPGGQTLHVRKGDTIRIDHIAANYERGMVADILGLGGLNDLHKPFAVERRVTIQIKRDQFLCGEVTIVPEEGPDRKASVFSSKPVRFFLEVDGKPVQVSDGDVLDLSRTSILKIIDAAAEGIASGEIKLNFVGFVPHAKGARSGEDRNYEVSAQALLPRFSRMKEGREYSVTATCRKKEIARITIRYEP